LEALRAATAFEGDRVAERRGFVGIVNYFGGQVLLARFDSGGECGSQVIHFLHSLGLLLHEHLPEGPAIVETGDPLVGKLLRQRLLRTGKVVDFRPDLVGRVMSACLVHMFLGNAGGVEGEGVVPLQVGRSQGCSGNGRRR